MTDTFEADFARARRERDVVALAILARGAHDRAQRMQDLLAAVLRATGPVRIYLPLLEEGRISFLAVDSGCVLSAGHSKPVVPSPRQEDEQSK